MPPINVVPFQPRDQMLNAALAYAEKRIYVLPLYWVIDQPDGSIKCGCGKKSCKSIGKHPIKLLVPHGHQDSTIDPEVIRHWWGQYPIANIGIDLAKSGLLLFDVDPRNGGDVTLEGLEAAYDTVASNWSVTTGGGGLHRYFRAIPGFTMRSAFGVGIDAKGTGYSVAPPSRTAGRYEWDDETGPLDSDEWPDEPPGWMVELVQTMPIPTAPEITTGALGFEWMTQAQLDEFVDALEHCNNWDYMPWLLVGMVLHMLQPDPAGLGFALWDYFSQLGEGIKKYDRDDLLFKWGSFNHQRTAAVHRESIFFWAMERGWKPKAQTFSGSVQVELPGDDDEVIGASSAAYGACPVEQINEIADLLSAYGGLYHPDASLAGAISLACTIASRRYLGTDQTPPHIYAGIAADSSSEVRYVLNGIGELIRIAGLRRIYRTQRFPGLPSFHKALLKSPVLYYVTTEWEQLLAILKRAVPNTTDQVLNTIADIYEKSAHQIDSAFEASIKRDEAGGDDQPIIYHPAFSILAALSADASELMAKSTEIGRGATAKMFTVYCQSDGALETDRQPMNPPERILNHMLLVRGINEKPAGGAHDLAQIFAQVRPADLPAHMIDVVYQVKPADYEADLLALSTRQELRPLIQGARTTMRRIAVALAAWADPVNPLVTPSIMQWAAGFVTHHASASIERIDVLRNEVSASVGQKVLAKLIQAGSGGLSIRDLSRMVPKFAELPTPADRQAVLTALVEDSKVKSVGPRGMQRGPRYVYARFIQGNGDADE